MAGLVRLLDQLLSDWITPFLNKEGFRKTGLSYEKTMPRLSWSSATSGAFRGVPATGPR